MRLPTWLYWSHGSDSVLRTQSFGSRRTGLHLFVMTARDGWRVWVLAAFGWALTYGGEDPVSEGRASVAAACPGHRYWVLRRFANGKILELSHAPDSQGEAG